MKHTALRQYPALIDSFEKHYRRDHDHEHGLLLDMQGQAVVEREGDHDSVRFSPQELDRACLGFLTHTHPHGKPPSADDLALGAQYGLTLRAVGTTPDGESWDYTVRFPGPSDQAAQRIKADYDPEVEQAAHELSGQYDNPWKLEREARSLAISRLAAKYGFSYQRVQRVKRSSVSEASQHERARLDTFAVLESSMRTDVFTPLYDSLVQAITRNTNAQGIVPIDRLAYVQKAIDRLVQRTMLGSSQRDGTLAPYVLLHGRVIPRSAYFKVLWAGLWATANAAVQRHADIMRKYLPDDLRQAFEFATINSYEQSDTPPLHEVVGSDGKVLTDRIWTATGDMSRKIRTFTSALIVQGKSASFIAQQLGQFLFKGPGLYEALRLSRSEVAATHARADSAAAQFNPFAETYNVVTSPRHKCCDECDTIEAGSPYPKNDTEHLPTFHANCLCTVFWNIVEDVQKVISRLRKLINDAVGSAKAAVTDIIGPLSKKFLETLFGVRS